MYFLLLCSVCSTCHFFFSVALPLSSVSLTLLGIRVSAEPLYQDPVVSTALYYEGIKLGGGIYLCIYQAGYGSLP